MCKVHKFIFYHFILFKACISVLQERVPPPVEDFLYVCDDTYTKNEFLAMERTVLKAVNFELGRPISYRFLRRYAMVRWN